MPDIIAKSRQKSGQKIQNDTKNDTKNQRMKLYIFEANFGNSCKVFNK